MRTIDQFSHGLDAIPESEFTSERVQDYLRDNPAGPHEELWYHGFGCRSWLRVKRDTRTHEIFAVEQAKPSEGTS